MAVPKSHEWWTKASVANLEDEEDDEDESEDEFDTYENGIASKSWSTPNLAGFLYNSKGIDRSVSNMEDSANSGSHLKWKILQKFKSDNEQFLKYHDRLESETKMKFSNAKDIARIQLESDRREQSLGKISKSISLGNLIGVPNLGIGKLTRRQLTTMGITRLQIILNDLHENVEALNEELMHLLMERENLHMEQDALLVDIEDLLQHHRSTEKPVSFTDNSTEDWDQED